MKPCFLAALCFFAFFGAHGPLCAKSKPQAQPQLGHAVPGITLPDTAGHLHRPPEFRKPCVLLFFCGCAPCHDFARLWAQAQDAGEIRGEHAASARTVVVFLGDAGAARQFTSETGLAPAETLILTDPSDQTGQRFGVVQCPRVFVLDAAGHLKYTNPESTDPPKPLSAAALVSRTLTAWHRLEAAGTSLPPRRKTAL